MFQPSWAMFSRHQSGESLTMMNTQAEGMSKLLLIFFKLEILKKYFGCSCYTTIFSYNIVLNGHFLTRKVLCILVTSTVQININVKFVFYLYFAYSPGRAPALSWWSPWTWDSARPRTAGHRGRSPWSSRCDRNTWEMSIQYAWIYDICLNSQCLHVCDDEKQIGQQRRKKLISFFPKLEREIWSKYSCAWEKIKYQRMPFDVQLLLHMFEQYHSTHVKNRRWFEFGLYFSLLI